MVEPAPTARPRRRIMKDEDYNAAICNNRANFNTKIKAIIEKYSQPNVDKRVVDLVSERFSSSVEEESPEEPPPLLHCKPAFRNGIESVYSSLDSLAPSVSKAAVKARRTNRGKLRRFPILSFRGLHLKTLRKQRLSTMASIAEGIRKRRAALHYCQPETQKEISRRSFEVCEEKQTVPSVSNTVQTPVQIKKTREVTDNNIPRTYRDLYVESSTWHSTPRPHQKEQENLCFPTRSRQLHRLSSIEQSPVKSDKLQIHQRSRNDNDMSEGARSDESTGASSEEILLLSDIEDLSDSSRISPNPCTVPTSHKNQISRNCQSISEGAQNNELRDDSSEEFILLSDVEDLADTSISLPKPCKVRTFPRIKRRNRPAATKSLSTRWDCRTQIPDNELPDEMFEVVIIDDPASVVRRTLSSHNARNVVTNSKQPAAIHLPLNSDKMNDDPDTKSESSVSPSSSTCCVLLHYDKNASTKIMRVSETGRNLCIFT